MDHSTDSNVSRRRVALGVRALASVTLVVAALGLSAPSARADGDPASDVLASQTLFLPADAGLSAQQQAQLSAELSEAGRGGYRLRVAIIDSPADLGSVTALWRQPQAYARFLGAELSLVYRGPLLVIMPDGFGGYRLGPPVTVGPALTDVRGRGLGGIALAAVRRLAAADGHPVTVPDVTVTSPPAAADTISWLALAAGCVIIALAWAASLRARPVRGRGKLAGRRHA